jgi:hypothetical protein
LSHCLAEHCINEYPKEKKGAACPSMNHEMLDIHQWQKEDKSALKA